MDLISYPNLLANRHISVAALSIPLATNTTGFSYSLGQTGLASHMISYERSRERASQSEDEGQARDHVPSQSRSLIRET